MPLEDKKDLVILICGLSGSGKSVIAESTAKKLGLKVIHASYIYRQIVENQKIDLEKTKMNKGFWESDEGKQIFEQRIQDSFLDKKVDEELLKLVEQGGIVIDSWTMPWLSKKGIKIWLDVSDNIRAKRLARRDKLSEEEVMSRVQKKEEQTRQIYKKYYGFDFGKDISVFDAIIKVDNLSIEEIVGKIVGFVRAKE